MLQVSVLSAVETLADRIALNGKLDAKEAVTLAARLALAIEQLHAAGDVHGAISSEALILRDGDMRKAALRSPASAPKVPSYFSPERLAGKPPAPEDDTWAIGALLYGMLTGHSAFAGATEPKVAERMRSGGAAPLAVFDVADDALATLVEAAIAMNPENRTRSVSDLRGALELWLDKRGLAIGERIDSVHDEPAVKVDLKSIPPPPKLPGSKAPPPPSSSPLHETLDEETTQPREDRPRRAPSLRKRLADAPEPKPGASPRELGERLPPTSELLARAKKATTRPPPRLNPPKVATKSSRPPPMPGAAVGLRPLPLPVPPPKPSPAPISEKERKSAPIIPLGPSAAETPGFDSDEATSSKSSRPAASGLASVPPKKGGVGAGMIAVAVAVVCIGAYALYRFVATPTPEPTASASAATSSAPIATAQSTGAQTAAPTQPSTTVASAPITEPTSRPTSQTTSTSSATAEPSSSAAPIANPADINACFASLLAEGAIAESAHPEFGFVCKDPDPRKASGKLKSVIVAAARGHVTDAMREWSMLGYWELAAFASMRGRCCPNARPIELPASPGSCGSMADALNAISAASHPGVSESTQADAEKTFHDTLRCIVKSGQHGYLGDYPGIAGGQDTAFMKTFGRTRL